MSILIDVGKWILENAGVVSSVVVAVAGWLGLRRTNTVQQIDQIIDRWWWLVEGLEEQLSGKQKWTRFIAGLWDDFAKQFGRVPNPAELKRIIERVDQLCVSAGLCKKNSVNTQKLPLWALNPSLVKNK